MFFFTDASSNEAVHLQQRLKSLSTELLTLRNRLHVGPTAAGTGGGVTGNTIVNSVNNNTIGNGNGNNNTIHSSTTTVNNTTSSPVIPITNSSKFNNKVGYDSVFNSVKITIGKSNAGYVQLHISPNICLTKKTRKHSQKLFKILRKASSLPSTTRRIYDTVKFTISLLLHSEVIFFLISICAANVL